MPMTLTDLSNIKSYRAPTKDNPWWPLPPDYSDLASKNQKKARLAVCCTQDTPEDSVISWDFFRNFYLLEDQPDGYFFDGFKPSPAFHYQGVYDLAKYNLNVVGAPRGFSKSTVFGTEIPLHRLVTRPFSITALCLATDRMVQTRLDKLMLQLSDNERILEDFGTLKPPKGEGAWNKHELRLANRARLTGYSVTGRKRGERPHLFLLDDPEYDPEKSTDTSALLSNFERMMFRVIVPMLKQGCKLFWIGTTINRKSFLYHAVHGQDPRFKHWNRRLLAAISWPSGHEKPPHLLWPEMASEDWLSTRRLEIGPSAFSAEYLNEPVAEEDRIFRVDPKLHGYALDGSRDFPLTSTDVVGHYKVPRTLTGDADLDIKWTETPINELLSKQYMVVTVDYALTIGPASDYSCVMASGIDTDNVLWAWDLWLGKVRDDELVDTILRMGRKWNARILGIESVSVQRLLVDKVMDQVERTCDPTHWMPRVFPIKYHRDEAKERRISALEWRFTRNRIKLPLDLKQTWPWSEFFRQVEDFTPDLNMLEHDDAIDTFAMVQYIVRGGRRGATVAPRELSLLERIERGDTLDENGFPLVLDPTQVSEDVAQAIVSRTVARNYKKLQHPKDSGLKTVRVLGKR